MRQLNLVVALWLALSLVILAAIAGGRRTIWKPTPQACDSLPSLGPADTLTERHWACERAADAAYDSLLMMGE